MFSCYRHARSQDQGGTCQVVSPWKSRKVIWCTNNDSKRLNRPIRIIYAHFKNIRRLLGASPQTPLGLRLWTPLGDGSRRPLICPPLEKNPAGARG